MEVEYTNSTSDSNSNKDINKIIEENAENEVTINSKKSKYDHVKKMEIKKKIEKIKKKEYLVDIFRIITSETKDYSENNNGVFIFFHDLPDEVYEKVENYVNNIYKLYKSSSDITSNIFNSELSETINEYSDKDIDKNLTNKEKMILRRKKYEEYLSTNQEEK